MNNRLCKNEGELYKLLTAISVTGDTFPSDARLRIIRQLMVDYHYLVLENKVPEFNTNVTSADKESFKELMGLINEILIEEGKCPMVENSDGSLSIDIDEIRNNPEKYYPKD